ncbi:MAG TPA: MFS transporter, partial [Lentisphaeria bacterium]|nr:MFS transporter [Lentisphaeria bacterium]
GDWFPALLLLAGGTIGFTISIVFYDALLPHLAPPDRIDMISSQGYALGYLGGGVLLAVNFLFILALPGTIGARMSFLSAAVWWAVFTIPIMVYVDEPGAGTGGGGADAIRDSIGRLKRTFREIRSYKNLFLFLVAFWFYNDGIGTVIRMAAIYGSQLGISIYHLVGALLLTQFVGIPFSIGPLPERKRRLVEFGLKAHLKTFELLKGGKVSGEVVREYMEWVKGQGFDKYMLYGPCHSIGLMEVEYPWMESTSTYPLKKNLTYQVDTFFYDTDFGLRWENGARITDDGVEMLSSKYMKYTEL